MILFPRIKRVVELEQDLVPTCNVSVGMQYFLKYILEMGNRVLKLQMI